MESESAPLPNRDLLLRSSFLPVVPAGAARTVPGRRRGMTYTEEDWVDHEAISHRRPEE